MKFTLPAIVTGSDEDRQLGREMIEVWRRDGIFEVQLTPEQATIADAAIASSKRFFKEPVEKKKTFLNDTSYSGYIASKEEITAGEEDYSEIFTVYKDLPLSDARVAAGWPCHGPVPWPDDVYQKTVTDHTNAMGDIVDRLLQLASLGLGLALNQLKSLTEDGWHHMRILRFQKAVPESDRGIGSHTDYGFLVIAVQKDAEGLDIRPPLAADGNREVRKKNWLEGQSTAGEYQSDPHWVTMPLTPDVVTVFPGDLLQYLTGDHLISTPHKIVLHPDSERYALAYFHEPNFKQSVRPLMGQNEPESITYGEHFTNVFMRCYPDRPTTLRITEENRQKNY
ncbi:2-oxoglutarate and iron-dependent oxygenase domain-containing protein [Erwinia psidii]|uniref:2-oxoglutarate-dependent ethylene/succinate-forming enzyme n=1 Tax=Erwinia psidii TaxID=69224 RepID=A0A3N6RZ31_9GAMM|nr:2-oxoglutarate and iron-dependent oxygenase domain-containing protein [Erwinia psidii]MCX8957832.1 isopenicillin N synthase family oxygenase [Erwinia psidii]MCX8960882.1 isopenicillin N synthase family oxygenase [Erwinia psidii]MCX8964878.1 isopenicillin N synthase family oxygenase [Erwinia psidii]RQM38448.1 isopenicillin N synthase family oxygenase [Erwinia psidii]